MAKVQIDIACSYWEKTKNPEGNNPIYLSDKMFIPKHDEKIYHRGSHPDSRGNGMSRYKDP